MRPTSRMRSSGSSTISCDALKRAADSGLEIIVATARWKEMAPDALDEEVTLEEFQLRLKRHSGQIKNILTNDTFLAGIGNAYADEILFTAGIYPFWPRPSLSDEETEKLDLVQDLPLATAAATSAQCFLFLIR